jgi:hypothetical protein
VPEISGGQREELPEDLPDVVVKGLRNWHRLPQPIRNAVEALLRSGKD